MNRIKFLGKTQFCCIPNSDLLSAMLFKFVFDIPINVIVSLYLSKFKDLCNYDLIIFLFFGRELHFWDANSNISSNFIFSMQYL